MSPCTIVVPCYNEAARLDVAAFERFAADGHPQQFLFVNDGSTDETGAVLQRLSQPDPQRFMVHALPRNQGKAEAVRQGVLRAIDQGCELVGYWDADLATPLEAIPPLCEFLRSRPELAIVVGARVRLLGRQIERRPLRHYLGRVFATAASLTLRLPIYDTQCGAKLFRATPEIRRLFEEPFRSKWIFDVELLARFCHARRAAGLAPETAIYEWPLDQWRDVAGSKVRARDFVTAFVELARIYWSYRSPAPAPDFKDAQPLDPPTQGAP